MFIFIETIPHSQQRYSTVGDWQFDRRNPHTPLRIRVSKLGNHNYEMAVGLHELVEALLCRNAGITEASVDAFDKAWKPHSGYDEPGDDPAAPYHRQHVIAGIIERLFLAECGEDWTAYENALEALL